MKRVKLKYPVIVEGRYDKSTLASFVDAPIFPVGGFAVFNSSELRALIRAVAKDGVIILTDSDGGGRQIRSYLNGILDPALVHNAYVPKIKGKEKRKPHPSKEGVLGVEGLDGQTLLNALAPYFADSEAKEQGEPILPKDLYLAGLAGGADSAAKRGTLAKKFDLPPDLSSKAFLTALNVVTDKEGFLSAVKELGL